MDATLAHYSPKQIHFPVSTLWHRTDFPWTSNFSGAHRGTRAWRVVGETVQRVTWGQARATCEVRAIFGGLLLLFLIQETGSVSCWCGGVGNVASCLGLLLIPRGEFWLKHSTMCFTGTHEKNNLCRWI